MSERDKLIENLKQQIGVRIDILHFTVINEDDFIMRIGRRRLNEMRDEILDFIIDLRSHIKNIEKNKWNESI